MTCMIVASIVLLVGAAGAEHGVPSFLFLLGDDIGWADFGYNNGTARTPNIDAWTKRDGSIVMQDGHSGGTVCSPTRATILTGRNHFRDCVSYVYECSDMTECDPHFPFAQQRTFTFPDVVRAANRGYESWFGGKWHLGSFFNDSSVPSSPLFHGFDRMNATVEVTPTATANCGCNSQWEESCNFGHYHKHNHCSGGPGPGAPIAPNGCCFNYWWENASSPHGISNLTNPSYDDDSAYIAEAFVGFLESRRGRPFAAQVSFHNCHIPFIGTAAARQKCRDGTTCASRNKHGDSPDNFTDFELDYYACLSELDNAVGTIINALDTLGYYNNTFIWFATDNGPEINCGPDGYCSDSHFRQAPGDAGPLRGRKRDIWEGGHRVPTIVSWPSVQRGPARVSWDTVVTMDFVATMMEVLQVDRPAAQRNWGFDGKSILPILKGEQVPDRGIGWIYNDMQGYHGYRYGKWKFVHGSTSCQRSDCKGDALYNLEVDLAERHDLSHKHPNVLKDIKAKFSKWYASIVHSREHESLCGKYTDIANKNEIVVTSREECCKRCEEVPGCVAADFGSLARSGVPNPNGVFLNNLEDDLNPVIGFACHLHDSHDAAITEDACAFEAIV
eukprot:TRINITY_DN27104_c0_g1_i1.p1 TRINITY_DN27104_c0_g1~~TRINITY_DN27104_c0_g1_i1.p1  ORF type:complete len:615 (-),score=33.83 TRINITY_DN27104_c0_g1_i1:147-1991(-)